MLEDEPGVGDVERPPFVGAKRRVEHVALAEVDGAFLSRLAGEARRRLDLLRASLDAHGPGATPGRARHGPGELPQAASEVDDALSALERGFAERPLVQDPVQDPEAVLLFGGYAVDVARRSAAGGVSSFHHGSDSNPIGPPPIGY